MEKVKIGIIGVGGFGRAHLASIAACEKKGIAELAAVAIRNPEKYAEQIKVYEGRGIPVYSSYQEMLDKEVGNISLIAIPAGISEHEEMSIASLKKGYDVMCEKPVTGTIEEALNMKKAAIETGKVLAIGYQNIFSSSIQKRKKYRLSGRLGKLLYAKTYVMWPRSSAYYKRNPWAGNFDFAGKKIYDSPMQNATAHFLQNMLYIAGSSHESSAMPKEIYGENYRVKDINSADTQYLRVQTTNGIRIDFISTHAVEHQEGPITIYEYEKGKI